MRRGRKRNLRGSTSDSSEDGVAGGDEGVGVNAFDRIPKSRRKGVIETFEVLALCISSPWILETRV